MQKLFRYGSIQDCLDEYYKKYGTCASVKEMLEKLEGFEYLKDEEAMPCPDFLEWDLEDLTQLARINRQVMINALEIQRDKIKFHNEVIQLEAKRNVMPFLHYAHHKVELRKKDAVEICYVLEGNAVYYEPEKKLLLQRGDLILIGSEQAHDIVAEPSSVIWGLQLNKKTFEQDFQRFLAGSNFLVFIFRKCLYDKRDRLYQLYLEPGKEVNFVVSAILNEFNHFSEHSQESCICYTENFFYILLRNIEKESYAPEIMRNSKDILMASVMNDIYMNYDSVSLKSLSEKYNYSENYIGKIIKDHAGLTFMEIVQEIKIYHAKKLLENPHIKMNEVARSVGYSSQNHFSRMFHMETGMSPSQYRKRNMKENE